MTSTHNVFQFSCVEDAAEYLQVYFLTDWPTMHAKYPEVADEVADEERAPLRRALARAACRRLLGAMGQDGPKEETPPASLLVLADENGATYPVATVPEDFDVKAWASEPTRAEALVFLNLVPTVLKVLPIEVTA